MSVIIPIYNVEAYLDQCIRSVCEQTYRTLEIILVDDGSPDSSPEICDRWAAEDSRIKVIHKTNGGLSDARNAGLDVATGQYIYFLDSDDYIKPNLVETVLQNMDESTDMVVFNYAACRENGSVETKAYHQLGIFYVSDENRMTFLVDTILGNRIGWEAWNRVYRRDLIEKYCLRFADNRVVFAEDMYFCLCYCAHARKVVSISQPLYYYRLREGSIMARDGKKLNVGRFHELAKAVQMHLAQWEQCRDLAEHFSFIYPAVMQHCFYKIFANTTLPPAQLRDAVWQDVEDQADFRRHIQAALRQRRTLRRILGGAKFEEHCSFYRYLLDGNYLALRLRNRLIYTFWASLNRHTPEQKKLRAMYQKLKKEKKRVFLLGTEEYGNIGDHQINEAIHQFLTRALPGYVIHEVTIPQWSAQKAFLRKCIKKPDLIVLPGGGNLGDIYSAIEEVKEEIIHGWPRNPKIVFPQTIYFSAEAEKTGALPAAREAYTKNNRVCLCVREHPSYLLAQKNFSCDIELVPDIVLYCRETRAGERKQQVLLCLRSDLESARDAAFREQVAETSRKLGAIPLLTDLQLSYSIRKENRKHAIEEHLERFRESKVVVTDRLHGMIFAAITGTPCIALGNYNHKVAGVYEWIRYLPYIRFAETEADVETLLPQLLAMENCVYDNSPLLPHFEKLTRVVRKYANDQCDRSGL